MSLMPKVIVIAGPTASGKSALAVHIAKKLQSAVINCDAMQIYKDIPVISAAPSREEKDEIPHYLYEIYDCSKRGNVVEWLDLCVTKIRLLWQENKIPVIVGGTGMYIDALINGVTPIPEVPNTIRQQILQELKENDLNFLYAWLQQNDEAIAQKLSPHDKTRITRAVEIIRYTKKKLSDWYQEPLIKKLPEAEFLTVKIVPSLDVIAERCRFRLDKMVYDWGALKEIEKLVTRNLDADLPAMKALGVPELSEYIKGNISLDKALELAKLHTRQYAKRQHTWLRHKLKADIEFENIYTGQPDYLKKIVQHFCLI